MANEEYLRPLTSDQSHEEAVKNGRKGGIASGEASRERKKLRECLEELLAMELVDRETGKKITGADAITAALFKKAKAGDIAAYTTIRDTVGEKPTDKMDIGGGLPIIIKEDLEE